MKSSHLLGLLFAFHNLWFFLFIIIFHFVLIHDLWLVFFMLPVLLLLVFLSCDHRILLLHRVVRAAEGPALIQIFGGHASTNNSFSALLTRKHSWFTIGSRLKSCSAFVIFNHRWWHSVLGADWVEEIRIPLETVRVLTDSSGNP